MIEEQQENLDKLNEAIERLEVDTYSLNQAKKDFSLTEDYFWGPECYERPKE